MSSFRRLQPARTTEPRQRFSTTDRGTAIGTVATPAAGAPAKPKRFHGTVVLDPTRVGRDAGRIADEVIAHLAGLVGSQVRVTP